jgi:hypothetical protein
LIDESHYNAIGKPHKKRLTPCSSWWILYCGRKFSSFGQGQKRERIHGEIPFFKNKKLYIGCSYIKIDTPGAEINELSAIIKTNRGGQPRHI